MVCFPCSHSHTVQRELVYLQWPADPRGWTPELSEWLCSRTSAGPKTARDLGSSQPEPASGPGCQTTTHTHKQYKPVNPVILLVIDDTIPHTFHIYTDYKANKQQVQSSCEYNLGDSKYTSAMMTCSLYTPQRISGWRNFQRRPPWAGMPPGVSH